MFQQREQKRVLVLSSVSAAARLSDTSAGARSRK